LLGFNLRLLRRIGAGNLVNLAAFYIRKGPLHPSPHYNAHAIANDDPEVLLDHLFHIMITGDVIGATSLFVDLVWK